ncbi:MAG: CvpA family protein [Niabella sp.]
MIIDVIVAVLAILAAIRGFRKGFIVGICSYLALIIGLAAAMKLSAVFAARIGAAANLTGKWVPFVSFLVVFALVALLVRTLSAFVSRLTEKMMLGIFNKLGGIVFFVLIYLSAFAILLFYIKQLQLLPQGQIASSATYPVINMLGAYAVNALGYIIPAFKDLFVQLENFFGQAAQQVP